MSLAGLPEGNGDSRAWRAWESCRNLRLHQGMPGRDRTGGMSSTRIRVKDVGRTRAKLDKD